MSKPRIIETETPPDLIDIPNTDGIRTNPKFTQDFRLRRVVYEKLRTASATLLPRYALVIYEAYRPIERQIALWEMILAKIDREQPGLAAEPRRIEAERFVANPYTNGSGHQAAAAIDVTLYDRRYKREVDMGTAVQEFCAATLTTSPLITPKQAGHRDLLRTALEQTGLINYPEEWWHFSYGERLWAELTGTPQTLFASIGKT